MQDRVFAYAEAVLSGQEIAGPMVRQACERHLADLKDGPARGLVWHPDKAARAVGFFGDVLRLVDVEEDQVSGQRIALTDDAPAFLLSPWEAFIVGSLFGWYGPNGFRRFRVAYIEVGKGNGKSPLAAGVGLYMLTADGARNAEVYAAAAVKDQARIQYQDAVNMVIASPELSARLQRHGEKVVYNLVDLRTNSFFKAISSERRGLDGKRVHCALIDELHEHPNDLVANKMRAGTKGRQNALVLEITNSGFDRTSVCFQHHEYSERVLNGTSPDDSWFAYVCALDRDEDPLVDEGCWRKANPNLGVSIQPTYLREQVREARGMPSKASVVLRLNFCVWVDAENPWVEGSIWRACEDDFDPFEELSGRACYGGLDLSGTRDLTALALFFPNEYGPPDAFVEFWTPGDTLEQRARDERVPFDVWERAGDIVATPGRAVDYSFVAHRIGELQQAFDVKAVAFDPYRIKYFERDLALAGVEVRLIPHGQGYFKAVDIAARERAKKEGTAPPPDLWMPRSVELLEKAVLTKTIRVKLNPCLQWNSASAVLEADAKNNRVFTKRRSKGRIDGLVALTMAVGLGQNAHTEEDSSSEYQLFFV